MRCAEYYKIGVANNVHSRWHDIQQCNPYPVEILLIKGGCDARRMECRLHNWLDKYRMHGEWFKPPELLMIGLLDPNFDIDAILKELPDTRHYTSLDNRNARRANL